MIAKRRWVFRGQGKIDNRHYRVDYEELLLNELKGGFVAITRPYRRTARMFTDNSYTSNGRWLYVRNPNYADSPRTFVRAFLLIQKDIQELFDYIEPSDANMATHSHRIHELLLRTCVEVEANCTAILRDNGYGRAGNWNMGDYKKVEQSHFLSQYQVKVPYWRGTSGVRTPFAGWATGHTLPWFRAYNSTKHDRHLNFEQANFESLIDAISGLSAILDSQFLGEDFSPGDTMVSANPGGPVDGFTPTIGNFFRVQRASFIPEDQKYDFDRTYIDFTTDIFQNFPYQ